jgi:hypothetical protein
LASMPLLVNKKSRNLSALTPNLHFSGFNLSSYFLYCWKTSFRFAMGYPSPLDLMMMSSM